MVSVIVQTCLLQAAWQESGSVPEKKLYNEAKIFFFAKRSHSGTIN